MRPCAGAHSLHPSPVPRAPNLCSLCLSIASKRPEERAASRRIAEQFPAKLGWKPDVVEIVAGALMCSRYGLLRRTAMKIIAKKEMGSVDATRDTVFTDWAALDRFARDFVGRVDPRAAKSTTLSV